MRVNFLYSVFRRTSFANHGGGCTFSSALAGYMAAHSTEWHFARGRGVAIAGSSKDELADTVYEFANMKNASKLDT